MTALTEPDASLFREAFRFSADLGSVMPLWTGSLVMEQKSELKEGTLTNVHSSLVAALIVIHSIQGLQRRTLP